MTELVDMSDKRTVSSDTSSHITISETDQIKTTLLTFLANIKSLLLTPSRLAPSFVLVYMLTIVFCCLDISYDQHLPLTVKRMIYGLILLNSALVMHMFPMMKMITSNELVVNAYTTIQSQKLSFSLQKLPVMAKVYFEGYAVSSSRQYHPAYVRFFMYIASRTKVQMKVLIGWFLLGIIIATVIFQLIANLAGGIDSSVNAVIPWSVMTAVCMFVNTKLFRILSLSLENYKREMLLSPFFDSPALNETYFKLVTTSSQTHEQCVRLEADVENALIRKPTTSADDLRTESSSDNSSGSETPLSLNSGSSTGLQKRTRPATYSLRNRHESLNSLLVSQGSEMDIKGLLHELFILQHRFHLYNTVFGTLISSYFIFAVVTVAFVSYLMVMFNHLTEGDKSEVAVEDGLLEYLIVLSVYNLFIVFNLIYSNNKFSAPLKMFLNQMMLLAPPEKYDECNVLTALLGNLRFDILVFGYAVTKETILSLLATLVITFSAQLFTTLRSKTHI